jgi:hypothetical protein
VFSVVQTDPETSAIHFNDYAVAEHKDGAALTNLFHACFALTPTELLRSIKQTKNPAHEARLGSFAGNVLHEMRHYLDVVFTPYGFFRLRSAFEAYNAIAIRLADNELQQIPIPLMSGTDVINQKLLGLKSYSDTILSRIADTIIRRIELISDDNAPVQRNDFTYVGCGGDAILEALAYASQ